jgi:hypothetical protein
MVVDSTGVPACTYDAWMAPGFPAMISHALASATGDASSN